MTGATGDDTSEIRPFDRSFHSSPARRFGDDLQLVICVRHRADCFASLDDCERRCVHEITAALLELGVPRAGRSLFGAGATAPSAPPR